MTAFTVLTVDKAKDGQGVKGPFTTWKLGLRNGDGNEPVVAELFCPAGAQPPTVGATVEGVIEKTDNPSWLDKFKPVRVGGGGFGPRPEDPKRSARIQRMHSQDMALQTLALAKEWNILEDGWLPTDGKALLVLVAKTADWFDKDAQAAGDRA